MPLIQTAVMTILVLTAMLWPLGPLDYLENLSYDFWAERFQTSEDQPVAIVAIDQKSLSRYGDWPWPRSHIADMVGLLSSQGVGALGICLLYEHPDINSGLEEIQSLKSQLKDSKHKNGKSSQRTVMDLVEDAELHLNHDAKLITAVRRAKNTVLPLQFSTLGEKNTDLSRPAGLLVINSIRAPKPPQGPGKKLPNVITSANGRQHTHLQATGLRETFAELAGKAGGLGHINLVTDPDGKIRRIPLLISFKGRLFPALSLQLAVKYLNVKFNHQTLGQDFFGQPQLTIDGQRISADGQYGMLFKYTHQWTRGVTYSFVDVADGTLDTKVFKNKIVLMGATDEVLTQGYRIGSYDAVSSVEIFANALASILSPERLSRPSWTQLLEIVVLLYFAVFLSFVIPRVNLRIGAVILFIFLLTWGAAAFGLLVAYGYWIKLYGPVVLACAGFVMIQTTRFAGIREQEKVEIYKSLGLSYQGQGMLDMAYENFMRCSMQDGSVKNLMYNLGLDFERKRMFNKALAIYEHIRSSGSFKDIKKRINRLQVMENPLAVSVGKSRGDKTMVMDDTNTNPTFGRYEILRELGRGAMGTVYLGRDPKINRQVAIKTLEYAQVEADELEDVKARFFREAEAAGKLSHPNIVSIYDAGEEHDMAYIAMELLTGEDLTHHCKPDALLTQSRSTDIIMDVTAALDYAHKQGVIHRDIKPANIMLLNDGRVKVTDFGIARVVDASQTKTGIILGTPSYMSPEQVAGKDVDGRSDLFTLGIVYYQMLAGAKPFGGDTLTAILYAITHKQPTPLSEIVPEIDRRIERIVNRLLAKGVSKRYQSASQVLNALKGSRKGL